MTATSQSKNASDNRDYQLMRDWHRCAVAMVTDRVHNNTWGEGLRLYGDKPVQTRRRARK